MINNQVENYLIFWIL